MEDPLKRTCQALTRNGAPCKAPAVDGGSLCFLHADPARASRLGRDGGRKNRRSHIDLQIPDQVDAAVLRDLEVQALRAIASGEMEYRVAAAFFSGCNSLQRLLPPIDTAELGHKIAELEQRVAEYERQTTTDRCSSATDCELHRIGELTTTDGPAQDEAEETSTTQLRSPQSCAPNQSGTSEQHTHKADGSPENTQLDSGDLEQAYGQEEDDGQREN